MIRPSTCPGPLQCQLAQRQSQGSPPPTDPGRQLRSCLPAWNPASGRWSAPFCQAVRFLKLRETALNLVMLISPLWTGGAPPLPTGPGLPGWHPGLRVLLVVSLGYWSGRDALARCPSIGASFLAVCAHPAKAGSGTPPNPARRSMEDCRRWPAPAGQPDGPSLLLVWRLPQQWPRCVGQCSGFRHLVRVSLGSAGSRHEEAPGRPQDGASAPDGSFDGEPPDVPWTSARDAGLTTPWGLCC